MSNVFLVLFFFELVLLFFLSRFLTQSLSRLFLRITKSQHLTISLLAILFLPGVIVHELAHLITASILLVRTGEIEFMPKITDDGVKLGSVAIAKTDPFRRAIIGVAPVLVGTAIIIVSLFYFTVIDLPISSTIKIILELFILFEIGNTMFSSKKDMEGTIEVVVILILITGALFFVGFRMPQSILDYFSSQMVVEVVEKVSLLMLIPLGIDLLVIGGAKLLTRK